MATKGGVIKTSNAEDARVSEKPRSRRAVGLQEVPEIRWCSTVFGYETLFSIDAHYVSFIKPECELRRNKDTRATIGVPTLSIVASTASSVALILLLVVLFVLLQPKLKSFHHSRRDQGVSGEQVSIVVDGVPVSLPSYEEAVYGSSGAAIPPSGSRVQIVMAEGPVPGEDAPEEGAHCTRDADDCPEGPGDSEAHGSGNRSETVLIHQPAFSSPAHSHSLVMRLSLSSDTQDTESSDVQSLLSLSSPVGSTDDIPLLKDA
ncbi:sushi domain-containing protein 6 [Rhincodon typus]|uniref:sushi domain-containing protein 6 n=1 Tax=Rhincodon typus TaxID=259920 RepID=UPI002030CF73|nr:sushi domain-containing protein 6 [Rhincodon typus]